MDPNILQDTDAFKILKTRDYCKIKISTQLKKEQPIKTDNL